MILTVRPEFWAGVFAGYLLGVLLIAFICSGRLR